MEDCIGRWAFDYRLQIFDLEEDYVVAGTDKRRKYKLYDGYNYGDCKYFNFKGDKIYLNEVIKKGTGWY